MFSVIATSSPWILEFDTLVGLDPFVIVVVPLLDGADPAWPRIASDHAQAATDETDPGHHA